MCGVIVGILIVVGIFQKLSEEFGTMGAIFVSIFILIFAGLFGFACIKDAEEKDKSLNEVRRKESDIISNFISDKGFFLSKSTCIRVVNDSVFNYKEKYIYFLIDDIHKQFAILRCSKNDQKELVFINNWNCYSYSALLDFDVKESGVSVLPGRGCNAAIGAVLGGVTGAVIGSVAGSKRQNVECSSFVINIMLNDINTPLITIDCLEKKTYETKSNEYQEMVNKANEIVAGLTYIQANRDAVPQEIVYDNNIVVQENIECQNVNIQQRVCGNCGSVLDADSVFCGNCGTKYEEGV